MGDFADRLNQALYHLHILEAATHSWERWFLAVGEAITDAILVKHDDGIEFGGFVQIFEEGVYPVTLLKEDVPVGSRDVLMSSGTNRVNWRMSLSPSLVNL